MSFRHRLLVAFALVAAVPLVVLALGARQAMTARLTDQYEAQVRSLAAYLASDLSAQGEAIALRLEALKAEIRRDNRLRRSLAGGEDDRRYLLDYAPRAMALSGLNVLQIHDEPGVILSSGHFRNDYGRAQETLTGALESLDGQPALAWMRRAEGRFLALVRSSSLDLGRRRLTLIGGITVDRPFLDRLVRGGELEVTLLLPDSILSSDPELEEELRAAGEGGTPGVEIVDRLLAELEAPFVTTDEGPAAASRVGSLSRARILITRPLAPLLELERRMASWFLAATVLTATLAVAAAALLSSRLSQPLAHLARQTAELDLDRLDVDFSTTRRDEIGLLSRLLSEMTERLRSSARALREAERRAAIGDLARQVNHDIKNGLAPLRNVVRHLAQVVRERPQELPGVFAERRPTLESGISYLDELSTHYRRISQPGTPRPCDVNTVIREVVRDAEGSRKARLTTRLAAESTVLGDPLSLRRILDNLLANAIESLGGEPGEVSLATRSCDGEEGPRLRITVEDTGCGLTEEERGRVFNDFFTTKDEGTGLGLSIVRRLVMDLGGRLRVTSEVGVGSRFEIELPRVAAAEGVGAPLPTPEGRPG